MITSSMSSNFVLSFLFELLGLIEVFSIFPHVSPMRLTTLLSAALFSTQQNRVFFLTPWGSVYFVRAASITVMFDTLVPSDLHTVLWVLSQQLVQLIHNSSLVFLLLINFFAHTATLPTLSSSFLASMLILVFMLTSMTTLHFHQSPPLALMARCKTSFSFSSLDPPFNELFHVKDFEIEFEIGFV